MRILVSLALLAVATAAAEPLPVEQFFKRPDYARLALSPDGRRVAAIARGPVHDNLVVFDLDKRSGTHVAHFHDADVLVFYWTNNKRLLFAVGEAKEASGEARFFGWGAVDDDGGDLHVINTSENRSTTGTRIGVIRQGSSDAPGLRYLAADASGGDSIVIAARRRLGKLGVWRYHTRTGEMTLLSNEVPAGNMTAWLVDRAGVPRVGRSYDIDTGVTTVWYRDGEGQPWAKLDEGRDSEVKILPLAFDFDGRTLYVAWRGDDDKDAIYRYDFERRRPGERLARHLDVDMGRLVFSRAQRKLIGIVYDADKPGVVWLDEHMARLQKAIDAALPSTVNQVQVAARNPTRALVTTWSDVADHDYYLFDLEQNALVKIFTSRPWLKPAEMSPRKFVRYKARDGLEIPAYLTLPKHSAAKSPPLVVDIHGGPWIGKQSWGFDALAQFLASRGYAVLQPDFRGTQGYGWRHYASSFGEWGYAMQDDITDGVEWLAREGSVDRDRVCLLGASYGGYAALWGLMKTPQLYRCGVAAFAVTDLDQLFDFNKRDAARSLWFELGGKVRVGDPDKDRDKFRRVSPLWQVERLKAPVLLAFGGADERVPIRYGNAFRRALERADKKYEWTVYSDEGHGLSRDENRFDFYRKVEAFLKQHLAR